MAQPYPYLDDSVRLIGTPLSRSVNNYDSTANNSPNIPTYNNHNNGSPNASFTATIFKMSSRYDLKQQPRQCFFYISVICMLYCVIYRLFFYYNLYEANHYADIAWIVSLNGLVSIICLSILSFVTILITLIRIHNQCTPENVQILLFSVFRLCVIFILNIIIVLFVDSFILFTFISYVFNPSSSSNSNHVDIFWQSIRKYLHDAQSNADDKIKRLITIHYYCMSLYIGQTNRFSNTKKYGAGIFGRKQQQKAIQRLRPIILNEYNQRYHEYNNNKNRFGISTPQSLSSHHRRNLMNFMELDMNNLSQLNLNNALKLKHDDLQIWFSVILWMPIFLNDERYQWYWIMEKRLLRISLIALLIVIIYTETKAAVNMAQNAKNILIPTVIRCVLEVINLLNLVPFVVYDDPDFDNVAELYSSRELSTGITKKKRNDIVKEINKTYHNYCHNLLGKQQQQQTSQQGQGVNNKNIVILASHSFEPQQLRQHIAAITPVVSPLLQANNIKKYEEEDSTEYEEEDDSNM